MFILNRLGRGFVATVVVAILIAFFLSLGAAITPHSRNEHRCIESRYHRWEAQNGQEMQTLISGAPAKPKPLPPVRGCLH